MKTNIEYKNNVLYVKISGVLVGNKIEKLESELIPIILGLMASRVTINLSEVELIDNRGINSLIKVSNTVNRFKGKVVLCELNNYINCIFKHSNIFDYCFRSKNEKSSLEVFKI